MSFRVLVLLLVIPSLGSADDGPIRVAVFQGNGVGPSSKKLIAALKSAKGDSFQIARISAKEVQDGKLSDVDVLVHPGGSGSRQGRALGKKGREAVRQFVREGGGYLGICAGAYLATNDYSWSLNLIDAKVVDRLHWARGRGMVKLRLSAKASEFFRHKSRELSIYYAQGPLLSRREWDNPGVPDYESLAVFATEIAKNGAPRGVMARTSAAVRCQFGRGRVFCFSPHPELTEGRNYLIPLTVRWLAAREP
ncbi:MAG: BPL-N domain-containing protein [Gemmataceae bacterium]